MRNFRQILQVLHTAQQIYYCFCDFYEQLLQQKDKESYMFLESELADIL